MQNKITEIIIDLTSVVLKQRGEVKQLKERIKELAEANNTLYSKLKEEESKSCPTHDDLQYTLLTEENGKLRETIEQLRTIIEDKNARIAQLEMQASEVELTIESDTDEEHRIKIDTPLGEETTAFSEGDRVIIDSRYFNDPSTRHTGKIMTVHDDHALVKIDKLSYDIPLKYLAHLIETSKEE